MKLTTVAAIADNRVLGQDGDLPWPSIPADRRQYRARIADAPVILGRRTFDSMRDDRPGSAQIVLIRSGFDDNLESTHHATSVAETLDIVRELNREQAYVIGGASIYELFLPVVDRMVLSRIPGTYEGDAYFPAWNREEWSLVEQTPYDTFTLEEWVRTEE